MSFNFTNLGFKSPLTAATSVMLQLPQLYDQMQAGNAQQIANQYAPQTIAANINLTKANAAQAAAMPSYYKNAGAAAATNAAAALQQQKFQQGKYNNNVGAFGGNPVNIAPVTVGDTTIPGNGSPGLPGSFPNGGTNSGYVPTSADLNAPVGLPLGNAANFPSVSPSSPTQFNKMASNTANSPNASIGVNGPPLNSLAGQLLLKRYMAMQQGAQPGPSANAGVNQNASGGALTAAITHPVTAMSAPSSGSLNAPAGSVGNNSVPPLNPQQQQQVDIQNALQMVRAASIMGDPTILAGAQAVLHQAQVGPPLVQALNANDQKTLAGYTDQANYAAGLIPLINQYKEGLGTIPPGSFTPGIRSAEQYKDPRYKNLQNLSTLITTELAHIQGIPARGWTVGEMNLVTDAAMNPNQFYGSLNKNINTLQAMSERAILNKNLAYQAKNTFNLGTFVPYMGPTTQNDDGQISPVTANTPVTAYRYNFSNQNDAQDYAASLPSPARKAWLAEFNRRNIKK